MSNSASPQRLPLWIFVAADLLLLATAALVATRSAQPWTPGVTIAVVTCVGLGALVVLVPLVLRYERLKNEQLDDRQRALEALARTLTTAAEQISIATGGLNDIGERVQKNLRQADQLPQRLQEKVAEFQAQLASASDTEREEMERELATLRTSESDRLEATATQIAKAAADWARLEASTRQLLAETQQALAGIGPATTSALKDAQGAAEQALLAARSEANRLIAETAGSSLRDLAQARAAALADLDAHLAAAGETLAQRLAREPAQPATPTPPPSTAPAALVETPVAVPAEATAPEVVPAPEPLPVAAPEATLVPENAPAAEAPVPTPPKRPRRPKREQPVPTVAETEKPAPATAETAAAVTPDPVAALPAEAPADTVPAPAPEPTTAPAPDTLPAEPAPAAPAEVTPAVTEPAAAPEAEPAAAEAPVEPEAPRRRTARKPAPEAEPSMDLGLEDTGPAAAVSERVLSSDGATRLIATAYIGIGNRLFLRGEGPGLSWEKGVPLQFISIGKWRWETNEATGPVHFRLYKNDEIECAALGEVSIEPGHQQEVMATF